MEDKDMCLFGSGMLVSDSMLLQYLESNCLEFKISGDQLFCLKEDLEEAQELMDEYYKHNPMSSSINTFGTFMIGVDEK
jgi:hypothetical protein